MGIYRFWGRRRASFHCLEIVHNEVHAFPRHYARPSPSSNIVWQSIYPLVQGSHSALVYFLKVIRISSHLFLVAYDDKAFVV